MIFFDNYLVLYPENIRFSHFLGEQVLLRLFSEKMAKKAVPDRDFSCNA